MKKSFLCLIISIVALVVSGCAYTDNNDKYEVDIRSGATYEEEPAENINDTYFATNPSVNNDDYNNECTTVNEGGSYYLNDDSNKENSIYGLDIYSNPMEAWRKKYYEILHNYLAQDTLVIDNFKIGGCHFVLFDIDGDGIPELFILQLQKGGFFTFTAVYSFRNGHLVNINLNNLNNNVHPYVVDAIFAPPDNEAGIITALFGGMSTGISRLVIEDDKLVVLYTGGWGMYEKEYPYPPNVIVYYFNAYEVAEDEFYSIFPWWFGRYELNYLEHEINEENINYQLFNNM